MSGNIKKWQLYACVLKSIIIIIITLHPSSSEVPHFRKGGFLLHIPIILLTYLSSSFLPRAIKVKTHKLR